MMDFQKRTRAGRTARRFGKTLWVTVRFYIMSTCAAVMTLALAVLVLEVAFLIGASAYALWGAP